MEEAHCDRKQPEPAAFTKLRLQSCRRWLPGTRWIDCHTDSLSMGGHGMLLIHLGLILLPSPNLTPTKAVNGLLKTWYSHHSDAYRSLNVFPSFDHSTSGTYETYNGEQLGKRSVPQTGHPVWDEEKTDPGLGITLECIQLDQGVQQCPLHHVWS